MSKQKSHYDPDAQPSKTEDASSVPTDLLSHPSYQELMTKLNEAEQKTNDYWERLLRAQAEIDNAGRRNERDVANAHKYALEKFVNELLPIIDSLELGVSQASPEIKASSAAVLEGINLTLKMFYAAMDKFGVKQVNPVSEPFNPEFHQAISMQPDSGLAPGTVVSVLQKGYTLNGRLIRPALVVVAKAKE